MTDYPLPHVKPWVVAAADEIGTKFGVKTIGGWRAQDPFPDHPSGLAVDFMINDLPNGHAVGDEISQYLIDNAKRLGLKYEIWNRRSWNPTRGTWAKYTSTDNPHTDHVHATFLPDAPAGYVIPLGTANGIGGGGTPGDLVGAMQSAADALHTAAGGISAVGDFAHKLMWLALPSSQLRIAAGVLGIVFIFFGVSTLGRQVAG